MTRNQDFDVTGNVKAIEKLKCELLSCVSELFTNLQSMNSDSAERSELLSEIIIHTYLLSGKLCVPSSALDEKILDKLKLGLLNDDAPLSADYKELYRYFHRT